MAKVVKKNVLISYIIFCIIVLIILSFIGLIKANFLNNTTKKYIINNNTYNVKEIEKKNNFNKNSNYVTNTYEIDLEDIDFIADGMKTDDFYNIFKETSTYLEMEGTYSKLDYNFEKHYKYEELEELYLKLSSSKIVNLEVIGKSFDGRNIYSIEIGNGPDEIIYEGNIHAAEIAPALYLTKFAIDLVNKYEESDTNIVKLLNNYKIVIVPTVNPDGYDYSIFGKSVINNKNSYIYINDEYINKKYYKTNANGVDLNRNFPSQLSGLKFKDYELSDTYSKEKSTNKLNYFPGNEMGSEEETKAMLYFIYKHINNTKAYISLHSAGRVIYNEQALLSDTFNTEGRRCSNLIKEYTGYDEIGIDYDDGYGNDGNSTDFIEELAHGYIFSTKTGRLSTSNYKEQKNTMTNPMCVLTVETLESYTQDLDTIKNEWLNKKLWDALLSVIN